MVGQGCSDPAPGHFLAPLDYFLFEAENAAPLEGQTSSPLVSCPDVTLDFWEWEKA